MALFKVKPIDPVDFGTLRRPASPNTYLVCPKGFSAVEPDQEAPIFAAPLEALIEAWDAVASTLPRITEIESLRSNQHQKTYVQRTGLIGYPDVITVQFIDLGDGTASLALYSRSQYGYSDMGVNKRRVLLILEHLKNAVSEVTNT